MSRKRFLVALAAGLLACWGGCSSVENSVVYQPTRRAGTKYEPPPPPLQDMELTTADGTKFHARWCPRPGSAGALLYCHGNAGDLEGRAAVVHDLCQELGLSVLIFDYPGYGHSGGRPSEAGCYASAEAAYDCLTRQQGVPPGRIVVCGESLGGGVAADLASRRACRALVLIRTFTSVPDVARAQFSSLPVGSVMSNRFDNLAKLRQCRVPVFVAQADQDRVMPFGHGQKLVEAAGGPAELYRLHGLGHNDPLPPEFYQALRRFLEEKAPVPGG